MLVYILAIPDEYTGYAGGYIVDNAETPRGLNFSKVDDELRFEIRAYCTGETFPRPLVAVDLTGQEKNRDWTIAQLLYELDARRSLPGYEDEIKNTDGPLIGFGECDFDSDGFII